MTRRWWSSSSFPFRSERSIVLAGLVGFVIATAVAFALNAFVTRAPHWWSMAIGFGLVVVLVVALSIRTQRRVQRAADGAEERSQQSDE